MHDFKKLKVWERAIELTTNVYTLSGSLPSTEKYNLVSQMNRSAVSIPSNIAEGAGRNSKAEFKRFLNIAIASSFELETQILIAMRLSFVSQEESDKLITELNEIQNMLVGLSKSIN